MSTLISKSDEEKASSKAAIWLMDKGLLPMRHKSKSERGLAVFLALEPKTTTLCQEHIVLKLLLRFQNL